MKRFKDYSIRNKLNIFFILVIVIITLALMLPTYIKIAKLLRRNTKMQTVETIGQIASNIDHSLDNTENMANFIAYSTSIQNLLGMKTSIGTYPIQYYTAAERVMIINYSSIDLEDIEIYGNNGMIYNVPDRLTSNSYQKIIDYGNAAKEYRGKIRWLNEIESSNTIQLVKEIRDITTTQSLGTIRIGVKKEYLERQLKDITFGNSGYTVVLDSAGNYVAGKDLDKRLYTCLYNSATEQSGTAELTFEATQNIVTYQILPEKNLIVFGIIPENILYYDLNQLQGYLLALAIIACIFALMISIFLSNHIVKPLSAMTTSMDTAAKGDFTQLLPVESNDEIGRLSANFNTMIQKISSLIDNVYKKELLQKEAEFKMLQAQINPHFLYNALETINWSAKKNGMEQISSMVSALSKLMRISINNKRKTVTVKEELSCIEDYLLIQKTRYQDRITTLIDVPSALYPMVIPKLIIQPLVENAFVHGLEQKERKGIVVISAEIKDNTAIISVADNGVGMDSTLIEKIMADNLEESTSHSGIGILTVHRRIQFVYGIKYGITVYSKPKQGTKVLLTLPYENGGIYHA